MATLFNEPHAVNLKRPTLTKDAGNNATVQDYANPAVDRTVNGMFQQRGGEIVQDEEGNTVPLEAVFFTSDLDVIADDLLTVDIPGTDEKFRVAARGAKYDVDGVLTHLELALIRETRF